MRSYVLRYTSHEAAFALRATARRLRACRVPRAMSQACRPCAST